MQLTSEVEFIIKRLNEKGHRADIVGGPVRDFLRGVTPSDYDITTSAKPDEIKAAFSEFRTIDTGIKHGTVTLILSGEPYEITTYRIDGEYLDARHPETVSFTADITEDLSRRDFTVNAMAYNPKDGITDPYFGRADIEKKILRAVGDPIVRFSEDALRILRALRFSATLGFEIEENTAKALRKKASLLQGISKERIYTEWKKMLSGDFAYDVISEFSDVISVFLPELKDLKLPEKKNFPKNFLLRETVLFYLSCEDPAPDFERAMCRLKTDTKTRTLGEKMLMYTGKYPLKDLTDAGVMFLSLGEEAAFATAEFDIAVGKTEKEGRDILLAYLDKDLPYKLSHLAVTGADITALGIKGPYVGDILSELLTSVVKGELKNEKGELLRFVTEKKL